MLTDAVPTDRHTPDTSGASRFWTSNDPALSAARALVADGRLADAEALLVPRAEAGDAAADEGRQVIAWVRRDYDLDEPTLLTKVREHIPDATAADLTRWRERGDLGHRLLDGRVGYFRSEPRNLLLFCDEAKRRRPTAGATAGWPLEDHVRRVVAAVDREGRPDVVPMRVRVAYALTVKADAPGLRPGALVRVWLPFPQVYRQQGDVRLLAASPDAAFVAPDGTPQRTIYFERRTGVAGEPVRFAAEFEYVTSAYAPLSCDPVGTTGGVAGGAAGTTAGDPVRPEDLAERPPHLVFTPELRAAVAEAVGDEQRPLERARRIFHWVGRHVPWNAEEEYGIVPSLVRKALRARRGDCGVQTMLFMAMCRSAGVPARWQSGWQTRRSGAGMHDWCEFHAEPWGWLPADPSYGLRDDPDPRVREFFFGNLDACRLIVSRDYGRVLCPPKQSLRSEPLDFQRGEVEVDGRNLYFDRWEYRFDVEHLDAGP